MRLLCVLDWRGDGQVGTNHLVLLLLQVSKLDRIGHMQCIVHTCGVRVHSIQAAVPSKVSCRLQLLALDSCSSATEINVSSISFRALVPPP